MSEIRVRFAPSPTGSLHIGSVRTTLFNYLFARSQKAKMLLRIEDTDRERSLPEYEQNIYRDLSWLGLDYDEKPVRQSDDFSYYLKLAETLIAQGKAYRKTAEGKEAVYFRAAKKKVSFNDLIHGPIEFDTEMFDDLVIIKSDGSPTYHFGCVADDHRMGITHVIRGDDHISNTPKQILLYEGLGYAVPQFAHLPLILGNDGAPLSKRHGSVSITAFKEEGFLPQALLNFIALLGWCPEGDREIFSLAELVERFQISKVNQTAAAFNHEKLQWMNGEYIKVLPRENYLEKLLEYVKTYYPQYAESEVRRAAPLFQERIRTFRDFVELAEYFLKEEIIFDPEAVAKHWSESGTPGVLREMQEVLAGADFSDVAGLEAAIRGLAAKLGVKAGNLIHPLRVAVTGKKMSPGVFELISALGKERVLRRLEIAREYTEKSFR